MGTVTFNFVSNPTIASGATVTWTRVRADTGVSNSGTVPGVTPNTLSHTTTTSGVIFNYTFAFSKLTSTIACDTQYATFQWNTSNTRTITIGPSPLLTCATKITFTSSPPGATVWFIDGSIGNTPVTTTNNFYVGAVWPYSISYPGYNTVSGNLTVPSTGIFDVTLTPAQVCSPNAVECSGNQSRFCNASGTAWGSYGYNVGYCGVIGTPGTACGCNGTTLKTYNSTGTACVDTTANSMSCGGKISFSSSTPGVTVSYSGPSGAFSGIIPFTSGVLLAGNYSWTASMSGYTVSPNSGVASVSIGGTTSVSINVTLPCTCNANQYTGTCSGTYAGLCGSDCRTVTYPSRVVGLCGYLGPPGTACGCNGTTLKTYNSDGSQCVDTTANSMSCGGYAKFTSVPSSAIQIFVNGSYIGTTSSSGLTTSLLAAGTTHSFTASLSGYTISPSSGTFTVAAAATTSITLTATAIPTQLSFTSSPSGATIYLDASAIGSTPITYTTTPVQHWYYAKLSNYINSPITYITPIANINTIVPTITLIPQCTSGQYQCNGTDLQQCMGGTWISTPDATKMCTSNGAILSFGDIILNPSSPTANTPFNVKMAVTNYSGVASDFISTYGLYINDVRVDDVYIPTVPAGGTVEIVYGDYTSVSGALTVCIK